MSSGTVRSGNAAKKPISDRISIFEKPATNRQSSSSPSSPVITSGRNISALKSQFSAAVAHDLEPPPKSPILIPKSSLKKNEAENSSDAVATQPAVAPQKPDSPKSATGNKPKSSLRSSTSGGLKSSSGGAKTSSLKSSSSSPTKTRKTQPTPPVTKTPLTPRSNRPVSPTKKVSSNVSPAAKKSTASSKSQGVSSSNKSSSVPLKSSLSKRPGSPTKVAPASPNNEPAKKLSLSRILSPEPSKKEENIDGGHLAPIKETVKPKASLDRRDSHKTLERRDSNRSVSSVLERRDSSKSVGERRDSVKSALDRKNSSESVERKDSLQSVLEHKDSQSELLERQDSLQSVLDRKNSHAELDRQDSLQSVLDCKNSQSELERQDSLQSVLDRKNSHSELERQDSLQSVLDRKNSHAELERQDSLQSVLDRKNSHSELERQDSLPSVLERQNSHSELEDSLISSRKNSVDSAVFEEEKEVVDVSRRESTTSTLVLERNESVTSVAAGSRKESMESLHGEKEDSFLSEEQQLYYSNINNDESIDEEVEQQERVEAVKSPVRSFPPPRCVTPPPPKDTQEEETPSPASLPTVKVTVEDIKLVKRDSSIRLPPTTVASDPEGEDDEDVSRLNLRNAYNNKDSSGGFRRNSIEKHIDTRVINANYMKSNSGSLGMVGNSPGNTSSSPSRYWTNQALQNDNSQTISEALKLDLEFKEEKINALNKELEDLVNGGAVEEEISLLKKQKSELDARLMDQEEELDDLAGQVQMLEQSKVKLEMSIAAQKKEHRKELSSKEEELEDARAAAQKRIKALEQQLENEHEERMGFVREKHDLETKIMNLQELASRSTDEEYVIKLKKNLKKTKALLKDAQCMIDMNRNDSSNKIVLRQLKNQLEDAEFAKTAAIKSRQNTEMELTEVQQQLDDVMRSKNDIEDKMMRICREKSDALTQLEDNEEELSDIMKKYKAAVSQLSVDQITITQQTTQITELEEERHRLKETLSELNQKIDNLESDNISSVTHSRLELKIRELESKLELEQATRGRMETQIGRLKEAIEKYNHECDILRNKELNSQDMARKLQRQLRDSKEDYASLAQKEMEANSKKVEYEKQLELAEAEVITVKNDLKLALKRFDQLQASLEGDSSEGDCGSDGESDSSDCEVSIFLDHHRRAMSVQKERESVVRELSAQRELRASVAREMSLRPLETMSELPEEAH